MNTPDSLDALRRANPRSAEGFDHLVGAAALDVRARIAADPAPRSRPTGRAALTVRSSRGVAVGALLAAAVAAAAVLTVVSPTGGPGVGDAAAAMKQAATVTAASAELSGTAVVRLAHKGETWSDTTMRWNGGDLAVTSNLPDREGRTGGGLRLVDGTLYGRDPRDGVWVAEGSPANIDPESGTTPAEHLAALREDVGGTTLQRIVGSMTGLSTTELDDGSTRYAGKVAAGLVARERGFKEGQSIRVLPFGNVAHGEAADPAALLDTSVTVGADGVVRELTVRWPGWIYTVTYSGLGTTAAPAAPENARPLRRTTLDVVPPRSHPGAGRLGPPWSEPRGFRYGFLRDSRSTFASCFATVGPCSLTVRATAGPCFLAERRAAWTMARRCSGGIFFHPCCAFMATSRTLNAGTYPEA
jgi:hypothetical protein